MPCAQRATFVAPHRFATCPEPPEQDVWEFLHLGGDIETKLDNGWTLLYCYTVDNKARLVEYLLKRGADPNYRAPGTEASPPVRSPPCDQLH